MAMTKTIAAVKVWIWGFIFVGFLASSACAQSIIKYLPRNEEMDTKVKNYASNELTLGQVPCSQGTLFEQASDCYRCLQEWLPSCHTCCIESGATLLPYGKRVKCSNLAKCDPPVFDPECGTNPCANLISMPASECVSAGANSWYCEKNNEHPAAAQCFNRMQAQYKTLFGFTNLNAFINSPNKITDSTICPASIGTPCYQYTVSNKYTDFSGKCQTKTDDIKACRTSLGTCRTGTGCPVTAGESIPGSAFFDAVCGRAACEHIAASPTCSYSSQASDLVACSDVTNDGIDCLIQGVTGACGNCFQEIDPAYFYKFVARSRESITLIWEIGSEPVVAAIPPEVISENETAPAFNFYSRIRVFNADDVKRGDFTHPVYESPIHQKYLGAAFSIFCAGQIDKDTKILTPGNAYIVKPYYYLPESARYSLQLKVHNLRLIAVRIRE